MGPYAFHGNQWVSYDDAATIRLKVRADREIDYCHEVDWTGPEW
jgi:hypothetical protein